MGGLNGGRLPLVAIALVVLLAGCQDQGAADTSDRGPLHIGTAVQSVLVKPEGKEVSWGFVNLKSPDERQFTVTSARAITEPADAALQPSYALEPPRDIGGVDWLGWPPKDPELGGTPHPLPAAVGPHDPKQPYETTELFIGVRSVAPWVRVRGIEIRYTDGDEEWTDVFRHELMVCTTGSLSRCEKELVAGATWMK